MKEHHPPKYFAGHKSGKVRREEERRRKRLQANAVILHQLTKDLRPKWKEELRKRNLPSENTTFIFTESMQEEMNERIEMQLLEETPSMDTIKLITKDIYQRIGERIKKNKTIGHMYNIVQPTVTVPVESGLRSTFRVRVNKHNGDYHVSYWPLNSTQQKHLNGSVHIYEKPGSFSVQNLANEIFQSIFTSQKPQTKLHYVERIKQKQAKLRTVKPSMKRRGRPRKTTTQGMMDKSGEKSNIRKKKIKKVRKAGSQKTHTSKAKLIKKMTTAKSTRIEGKSCNLLETTTVKQHKSTFTTENAFKTRPTMTTYTFFPPQRSEEDMKFTLKQSTNNSQELDYPIIGSRTAHISVEVKDIGKDKMRTLGTNKITQDIIKTFKFLTTTNDLKTKTKMRKHSVKAISTTQSSITISAKTHSTRTHSTERKKSIQTLKPVPQSFLEENTICVDVAEDVCKEIKKDVNKFEPHYLPDDDTYLSATTKTSRQVMEEFNKLKEIITQSRSTSTNLQNELEQKIKADIAMSVSSFRPESRRFDTTVKVQGEQTLKRGRLPLKTQRKEFHPSATQFVRRWPTFRRTTAPDYLSSEVQPLTKAPPIISQKYLISELQSPKETISETVMKYLQTSATTSVPITRTMSTSWPRQLTSTTERRIRTRVIWVEVPPALVKEWGTNRNETIRPMQLLDREYVIPTLPAGYEEKYQQFLAQTYTTDYTTTLKPSTTMYMRRFTYPTFRPKYKGPRHRPFFFKDFKYIRTVFPQYTTREAYYIPPRVPTIISLFRTMMPTKRTGIFTTTITLIPTTTVPINTTSPTTSPLTSALPTSTVATSTILPTTTITTTSLPTTKIEPTTDSKTKLITINTQPSIVSITKEVDAMLSQKPLTVKPEYISTLFSIPRAPVPETRAPARPTFRVRVRKPSYGIEPFLTKELSTTTLPTTWETTPVTRPTTAKPTFYEWPVYDWEKEVEKRRKFDRIGYEFRNQTPIDSEERVTKYDLPTYDWEKVIEDTNKFYKIGYEFRNLTTTTEPMTATEDYDDYSFLPFDWNTTGKPYIVELFVSGKTHTVRPIYVRPTYPPPPTPPIPTHRPTIPPVTHKSPFHAIKHHVKTGFKKLFGIFKFGKKKEDDDNT